MRRNLPLLLLGGFAVVGFLMQYCAPPGDHGPTSHPTPTGQLTLPAGPAAAWVWTCHTDLECAQQEEWFLLAGALSI